MRRPGRALALLLLLTLLLGGCAAREQAPAASEAEGSTPARPEQPEQSAVVSAPPEDHWENPSPAWVERLPEAQESNQLCVVAVTEGTNARFSLHQKGEGGTWGCLLEADAYIGKNGLGKTAEGDGKTPVGTFAFTRAFGIAADPGCAIPYVQVNGNHYWSGDQRPGMHYNELVSVEDLPDLDRASSEHIEDFWEQYQYCLNISYNADGEPGKGSAIFLHCQGQYPYTGGCVAIAEKKMKKMLRLVQPDCAVVIDTAGHLGVE